MKEREGGTQAVMAIQVGGIGPERHGIAVDGLSNPALIRILTRSRRRHWFGVQEGYGKAITWE
jgi:hypothetical protein